MKKQQGFTLIELMIAVAIVGILAAVAIPQYQNYIARSQASEALTLLSGLKTPVIEYYSINGKFPKIESSSGATDIENLVLSGQYVETIKGEGGSSVSGGVYTATFKGQDISARLFNKTIQMTFNSEGGIECAGGSTTPVEEDLLPASCKKKKSESGKS